MITFKCDRCGYQISLSCKDLTLEEYADTIDYTVVDDGITYHRKFSVFKCTRGHFLLCSDCSDQYPKVIDCAIDKATYEFMEELKHE